MRSHEAIIEQLHLALHDITDSMTKQQHKFDADMLTF